LFSPASLRNGSIYGQNNFAIFAYGSLLSDAEKKFCHSLSPVSPCASPWPVEYARRAKLRGDGQGIVTPLTHAYRGVILRLTGAVDLKAAEEIVARARGGP
jgi:hypothetical protein